MLVSSHFLLRRRCLVVAKNPPARGRARLPWAQVSRTTAGKSKSEAPLALRPKPKWRNWQTRWTQNPVGLTSRVGSTPTFGIATDPGKDVGVKVGVLTGGGDCPGLNAVIRAVARRSFSRGSEVVGVREGWRGFDRGQVRAARAARGLRAPAARRNRARHLAHEPVQGRRGGRRVGELPGRGPRRARGDRRRGHPGGRNAPARRARLPRRRRAEDDRQRPLRRPTTPSASTRRSSSAPRRSTGCTRPPSRTTA